MLRPSTCTEIPSFFEPKGNTSFHSSEHLYLFIGRIRWAIRGFRTHSRLTKAKSFVSLISGGHVCSTRLHYSFHETKILVESVRYHIQAGDERSHGRLVELPLLRSKSQHVPEIHVSLWRLRTGNHVCDNAVLPIAREVHRNHIRSFLNNSGCKHTDTRRHCF